MKLKNSICNIIFASLLLQTVGFCALEAKPSPFSFWCQKAASKVGSWFGQVKNDWVKPAFSKTQSFFQQNVTAIGATLVGLCGLAGLYTMFKKQAFTDQSHDQKYKTPTVQERTDLGRQLQHVPVHGQTSLNCGYHAAFNAFRAVERYLIEQKTQESHENIAVSGLDEQHDEFAQLQGEVDTFRREESIKKTVQDYLENFIPEKDDQEQPISARKYIYSAAGVAASNIAQAFITADENQVLTPKDIITYCKQQCKKDEDKKSVEVFNQYLQNDITISKPEIDSLTYLADKEVFSLLKYLARKKLLPLGCLKQSEDIQNYVSVVAKHDMADVLPNSYNNFKQHNQHSFVVNTGDHWYALTAKKQQDDQIKYLSMDSLNPEAHREMTYLIAHNFNQHKVLLH